MNVSYQHADLYVGTEPFLLRFDPNGNQTQIACVLVDAGQNLIKCTDSSSAFSLLAERAGR